MEAIVPPVSWKMRAMLLSVPLPALIDASPAVPVPFWLISPSLALPFWSIWAFSAGPSWATVARPRPPGWVTLALLPVSPPPRLCSIVARFALPP